jgi:hypothetical protein
MLSSALEDVAVGLDGGAGVCLSQTVLFTLELGRAVASGGTVRTTVCRCGRRVVVTKWLVIDPFELKFDRLNRNSII